MGHNLQKDKTKSADYLFCGSVVSGSAFISDHENCNQGISKKKKKSYAQLN